MDAQIHTRSLKPGGWLLVIGVELILFAIFMVMLLNPGGEIMAAVLVLGIAAVWFLRKQPQRLSTIQTAFAKHRTPASICLLILLISVPFVFLSSPYWLFILITAGLYIVACLGLNLQLGSTGMMNLASAAFYAFGAYTAGLLSLNYGWPTWLTLILGALVTGLFSILLFIPVLKTKGHYLALVTIAFQFMVTILVENMEWTGGPQGLKNIPLFSIFGYSFNNEINLGFVTLHHYANYYYFILIIIALVSIVCYRIFNSWVGLTLSTIRDDEVAAKTNGVQINYWKLIIFVLGNCFIGLAGAFYSHMVGFISPPNFTFEKSLVMVSIVILGGLDNIFGIILGSILLIVLPEKLRVIQDYRFLIYGIVLIVMLIYKPRGIIPFVPRSYRSLIRRIKPQKDASLEARPEGEHL